MAEQRIIQGDCTAVLPTLAAKSVQSVGQLELLESEAAQP